jgi:hypothetical protein
MMDGKFDCAERSYGCEINPMKVDYFAAPPPNNGMHPTRNSVALKLNLLGGRVMPGVRFLPLG